MDHRFRRLVKDSGKPDQLIRSNCLLFKPLHSNYGSSLLKPCRTLQVFSSLSDLLIGHARDTALKFLFQNTGNFLTHFLFPEPTNILE